MSTKKVSSSELSFWRWLFSDPRGLRAFANRWVLVHLALGFGVALAMTAPLKDAAPVVLALGGVIVGASFAWSTGFAPILREMRVSYRVFRWLIFAYQMAFLVILSTIVVWTLVALGVFVHDIFRPLPIRLAGRTALFGLSSVAIQEAWTIVIRSQQALIAAFKQQLSDEAGVHAHTHDEDDERGLPPVPPLPLDPPDPPTPPTPPTPPSPPTPLGR